MPLPRPRKASFVSVGIWCTSFLLLASVAVGLSITTNPFFSLLIVVGILASTLLTDRYRTRRTAPDLPLCESKRELYTPTPVAPSSRPSRKGALSEPCLRSTVHVAPGRSLSSSKILPYYKRPNGHPAAFTPTRGLCEAGETSGDYLSSPGSKNIGAKCLGNTSTGYRHYHTAMAYSVLGGTIPGTSGLPGSLETPLPFCDRTLERGLKTTLPQLERQNFGIEATISVKHPESGLQAIGTEVSNSTSADDEAMPENFQVDPLPLLSKSRSLLDVLRTANDSGSTANVPILSHVQGDNRSASVERTARIQPPASLRGIGSSPDRHGSEGFNLPASKMSSSTGSPSRSSSPDENIVPCRVPSLASPLSNVGALSPDIASALNLNERDAIKAPTSCTDMNSRESSSSFSPASSGTHEVRDSIWRSLSWSPVSCSASEEVSHVSSPGSSGHQRKLVQVPQWVKVEVENLSDARSISRDSLQTRRDNATPPCDGTGALAKTDAARSAADEDVELQERREAGKKNKKKFKFIPRFFKWKRKRQKRLK